MSSYCKRMKRPCTCNRLTVYQRDGRDSDQDNGASCLTDSEIRQLQEFVLIQVLAEQLIPDWAKDGAAEVAGDLTSFFSSLITTSPSYLHLSARRKPAKS